MKAISFVYFTNSQDALGVELKIQNFHKNFNKKGIVSTVYPINTSEGFIKSTLKLLNVTRLNSKFIFIRYNNSRNIFFFILMILLKFRRKRIILEIPTPIINHCKEIIISKSSRYRRLFLLTTTWLLGPLPFLLPDLIIQYAEENIYFKLLSRNNLLMGNGIDVESYAFSEAKSDRFRNFPVYEIIVIANLAPWHGIDLLIEALSRLEFKFHLHIVGDGPEKTKLRSLAKRYKLGNNISFYGKLSREEYLPILEKAHLGIGSLNWDIIDVKISSALKLREYVSAGLPVIFSSFDPDLSGKSNCIQVKCNVESVLNALIECHKGCNQFSAIEQIELAKKELDMSIKVESIINKLSSLRNN